MDKQQKTDEILNEISELMASGQVDRNRVMTFVTNKNKRRPKLNENEKRSEQIIIRLTKDEKKKIMALARKRKINASSLIRRTLSQEIQA